MLRELTESYQPEKVLHREERRIGMSNKEEQDNPPCENCGEYEEAHDGELCPSAKDYGKKFKSKFAKGYKSE